MKKSIRQFGLPIISGAERSLGAGFVRAVTGLIEPFYAGAMQLRNAGYHRGWPPAQDLQRATISVGNITTGGTGKTPVVKWLATKMLQAGRRPAVLLRGYGSSPGQSADEAQTLRQSLNIPVQENPSRADGAAEVLRRQPQTDLFILDDGFQHRRARRNFDLVLISATQPFGFGHVLPRGLLREPLGGLKRADAFLVTRCSLVDAAELQAIDRKLRSIASTIPIYHCDHQLAGVWMPIEQTVLKIESLVNRKVFLMAGIADPGSLLKQISSLGVNVVGHHWFDDHHRFESSEVESVIDEAIGSGADLLLMTEKDWVKVNLQSPRLPVGVLKLEVRFWGDDEANVLKQIANSLGR